VTGVPPTGVLRLSVIGLTGSGKSTFAAIAERLAAERGLTSRRVKLAKPLYDLQQRVYEMAGAPLRPGDQDQVLMETLARTMRRIRPRSLIDRFLAELTATDADVVVNDDLRDPHVDAVVLREHGFRIVRVRARPETRAARLAERGDLTRAERSTEELSLITTDAVIDNDGDLDSYEDAVRRLLGAWL
jgi:dephospho-CoA kinase